jgi:hypothetical protein
MRLEKPLVTPDGNTYGFYRLRLADLYRVNGVR